MCDHVERPRISGRSLDIAQWDFPGTTTPVLDTGGASLFELWVDRELVRACDFAVVDHGSFGDGQANAEWTIGVVRTPDFAVTCRLSVSRYGARPDHLTVQLACDWTDGLPRPVRFALPAFRELADRGSLRSCSRLYGSDDGAELMMWGQDDAPPLVLAVPGASARIGFGFPARFPWWSNSNRTAQAYLSAPGRPPDGFAVKPTRVLTDVVDIALYPVTGGWIDLFRAWKRDLRTGYDLSNYRSPASTWARHAYLQHFTFAFGTESFDYDHGTVAVDRLLSSGEEFGGFDALVFWHQYPRLGLDARTQWDLYDELPGGESAIGLMAQQCHERQVRLLLPFKPWDVHSDESIDDQARQIERLVSDHGVDGFFLDTMASVPLSFVDLQRSRFPDLLFASEVTPKEPRQVESIVSSWDQGSIDRPVNVNLLRFAFPEHALNMISRWSVGSQKDDLIKRAVLNATGLVIWQDVFGAWLPYSPEQKRAIREWKAILSQYHAVLFGFESVPLLPTGRSDVIANLFSNGSDPVEIYTVYNGSLIEYPVEPHLWAGVDAAPFRLVYSFGGPVERELPGADESVVSIAPGEVMVLLVERIGERS